MAKAEVKAKLDAALKSAVATPISAAPASPEPAAQVEVEAVAPLESVDVKLSPEMAENLRPVLDQVEASLGDEEEMKTAYSVGISVERIYIVSAPGGPRRRAGHGFGPVPVELVWEDFGDTDEAREKALNEIRADPMLKLDGRYEEHPAED